MLLDELAPFIMIIAVTWLIVLLFIHLLKYRIRKRMIETNLDDENVIKAIFETKEYKERGQDVLKWTSLGFFGGLGLVFQEFLPYSIDESMLPFGVVIIFLSIGLLVYYLLINYLLKNRDSS